MIREMRQSESSIRSESCASKTCIARKERRDESFVCISNYQGISELRGNKSLNSHPLMGYRNPIAEEIGLDKVPDPDTTNSSVSKFYVETFFERFYTVEAVVSCIRHVVGKNEISSVF